MPTSLDLATPPPVTRQPHTLPATGAMDMGGLTLAVAVAPGIDAGQVDSLLTGLRRRGAFVELVAPTLGVIETPRGSTLMPDRTFGDCSPMDYDAVVVPDGNLKRLREDGAAIAFATRAYLYGVPIGLIGAGAELLHGVGDSGVLGGERAGVVRGTRACPRFLDALAAKIATRTPRTDPPVDHRIAS